MSTGESVHVNFGATDLCYSTPGYRPLQEPPLDDLATCRVLFPCLDRLVSQLAGCSDSLVYETHQLVAVKFIILSKFDCSNVYGSFSPLRNSRIIMGSHRFTWHMTQATPAITLAIVGARFFCPKGIKAQIA